MPVHEIDWARSIHRLRILKLSCWKITQKILTLSLKRGTSPLVALWVHIMIIRLRKMLIQCKVPRWLTKASRSPIHQSWVVLAPSILITLCRTEQSTWRTSKDASSKITERRWCQKKFWLHSKDRKGHPKKRAKQITLLLSERPFTRCLKETKMAALCLINLRPWTRLKCSIGC